MRKLNKAEQYMLLEGLKMYSAAMKADIKLATKKGKTHIFSESYVDMTSKEIEEKLKTLTLK